MTSTSPDRISLMFGVLAGLAVYFVYRTCVEKVDEKVRLAQETVRVDYSDGVSCYHRGSAMSCVYVRRTYGPDPLTSWPETIP